MSQLKLLPLIFIILVLDLIAFTSILPLLPSILSFYEHAAKDADDSLLQRSFHLLNSTKLYLGIPDIERYNGVLIGGVLGSLYSLLQFICNPFYGAMSDVFGRKKILLITMCGTSLSYILWIKSISFELFFLSRVIGGISKGSVTIVTAMMSDITDESDRGKGMAVIGIAFAVAFIVGPLCGAYFAANVALESLEYPFTSPAIFSLSLQSLAIILAVGRLQETLPANDEVSVAQRIKAALTLINPGWLFDSFKERSKEQSSKGQGRILLITFLFLVFFSGLEFTLTFLTHQRFGFGNRQQGMLFLFVGVIMVIIQGGYVRKIRQGQEKQMAASGIFTMIPSMVIMAIGNSIFPLYIGLAFFSFSAATVVPCLTALYSQKINRIESGEMLGILRSVGALARALGPFIICFVYWTCGSTFCYIIGACFFCVPLTLCYLLDASGTKEE